MILYVGNKLSKYGNTPTSVEILGSLLAKEMEVVSVSDKSNKILRIVDMLWSIIKYRKNIDFILIDTYSTLNFYFAFFSSIVAKVLRLNYIPLLRGGDLERRLVYSPKMSKILFSNAYKNIAPSTYLQYIFKKYGYSVECIPNNIEIGNYPYKQRGIIRPKLLYVRAFSVRYNPFMALEVLIKLLEKYNDATLCMVGPERDGTLAKMKEKAKTMGIEDKILFTGKLNKEEWWKKSEEYDIFINTTNVDNTPVSVMEAMALGLPIVSTNVGGIPYLLEDNIDALLVSPNNAEEMVEKISLLVEEKDKTQKLIRHARKKVEGFDWKNIKYQWFSIIGNVKS